jgi:hypothetical protein
LTWRAWSEGVDDDDTWLNPRCIRHVPSGSPPRATLAFADALQFLIAVLGSPQLGTTFAQPRIQPTMHDRRMIGSPEEHGSTVWAAQSPTESDKEQDHHAEIAALHTDWTRVECRQSANAGGKVRR